MTKHPPSQSQQAGSALIMALLLMAFVVMIATMMITEQQAELERARLVLNVDRAYLALREVEVWGISVLARNRDALADAPSIDLGTTRIDDLPEIFPPQTLSSGETVRGELVDAQSRYNLNNMIKKKEEPHFIQLILAVEPDLSYNRAKAIAASVHEWVIKPKKNEKQGVATKESSQTLFYAALVPPYHSAQNLMVSASELRLIKGMTPQLYQRLAPFVIALPQPTPININTASAPVLASLSPKLDIDTARELVAERADAPFDSLDAFLADQRVQSANIDATAVTYNSEYFLTNAVVLSQNDHWILRSLLHRPLPVAPTNNQTDRQTAAQNSITVLWESRGGI